MFTKMKLKRYTTEELKSKLIEIFLNEMSEGLVEKTHEKYVNKFHDYETALALYTHEVQCRNLELSTVESLTKQIPLIKAGLDYLMNSNMSTQMKLYAETNSVDFSHTTVKIPLNKKLNSFYDDLILEVVFFDDVCTLNGYFDSFKVLDSKEEKIDFIKQNTVITHIGLVYEKNNCRVAVLKVLGNLNHNDERTRDSIELLEDEFSDFENLTLSKISTLQNNDLKQWLQTKIDLDKENMRELAHTFIRGDYYSIHRPQDSDDLYIRYICRSTGRVYYNRLNLDNLKLSKEFRMNDYNSYCRAWWNLCHLGTKVDGKPIIAC